jgi:hypothetical protein
MLPESVCTSSELLQPSISHPSLSTHIFLHERSSAKEDETNRGRRENKTCNSGKKERKKIRRGVLVVCGVEIIGWSVSTRDALLGSCL